jgi:hypothetical protein
MEHVHLILSMNDNRCSVTNSRLRICYLTFLLLLDWIIYNLLLEIKHHISHSVLVPFHRRWNSSLLHANTQWVMAETLKCIITSASPQSINILSPTIHNHQSDVRANSYCEFFWKWTSSIFPRSGRGPLLKHIKFCQANAWVRINTLWSSLEVHNEATEEEYGHKFRLSFNLTTNFIYGRK